MSLLALKLARSAVLATGAALRIQEHNQARLHPPSAVMGRLKVRGLHHTRDYTHTVAAPDPDDPRPTLPVQTLHAPVLPVSRLYSRSMIAGQRFQQVKKERFRVCARC